MEFSGIILEDGTKIDNLTAPGGDAAAQALTTPTVGGLFFRTDLGELQTYSGGGAWVKSSSGGAQLANAGDLLHTLDNPNAYGTSANDNFGFKAGADASGNYGIIGVYEEDDAGGTASGKAYIFNLSTGKLVRVLDNPNAYGTTLNDQFSYEAVGIFGDKCIVGASFEDDAGGVEAGKAYIYNFVTGELLHTLDNPTPVGTSAGDYFGVSVAISGNNCIVGASNEDDANPDSGKAYIFDVTTGALLHTLDNPNAYDTSTNDYFGIHVSISGNNCIVSAYGEDDASGLESGKAYIFNVTTGALVHTLDNPNPIGTSAGDYFGWFVAISGNNCVVTANVEDVNVGTGKAYIFDVTTGLLLFTLDNPNTFGTSVNDYFGQTASISDKYCVVSAPYEDDAAGTESGKAYVFDVTTGLLLHTLDNPNAYSTSTDDFFGWSVAISDDRCIVSSPWEGDTGGVYSGKAYIIALEDIIESDADNLLKELNSIDGGGSELDADLLDGQEGSYFAPIDSPTFTGTPSLPTGSIAVTQTVLDNSTKIATTAYVDASGGGAWSVTGTDMTQTDAGVTDIYFADALTDATPLSQVLHGQDGVGTDIAGATLTIAGGIGTGTGVGGDVVIQYATAGTTSATPNALLDVATFGYYGQSLHAAPLNYTNTASILQIGGTCIISGQKATNTNAWFEMMNNAVYDATDVRYEYVIADEASRMRQEHGTIYFDVAVTGGLAGNPISWTRALTVNNDGSCIVDGITITGDSGFGSTIAIANGGTAPVADDQSAIAIGSGTQARSNNTIAIGLSAEAFDNYTVAIGWQAEAGRNAASDVENSAIALGSLAKAYELNCVAIGDSAQAGALAGSASAANVAIGSISVADGGNAVAVGPTTSALGARSLALGSAATANEDNNIAIGRNSIAGQTPDGAAEGEAIALGAFTYAYEESTIAIGGGTAGKVAGTTNPYAIAIGLLSIADTNATIAIGWQAEARCQFAIAIGDQADAFENSNIAIGIGAVAGQTAGLFNELYAMAVGASATASEEGGTSLGYGTTTGAVGGITSLDPRATAVGYAAEATRESAVAIGDASEARGVDSIAIGTADARERYSIAIGGLAQAGQADGASTNDQAIALGYSAKSYGKYSVAIGASSVAGATGSSTDGGGVAIGGSAFALFINAIAIGNQAEVRDDSGIAIGYRADVRETTGIAIGDNSQAGTTDGLATNIDAIAIGTVTEARAEGSIAIGAGGINTVANTMIIGGVTQEITDIYIGKGHTSSTPTNAAIHPTGQSGLNKAGVDMTITAGQSTGNLDGGDLVFQVSPLGASSSALNTLETGLILKGDGHGSAFNTDLDPNWASTLFNYHQFGPMASMYCGPALDVGKSFTMLNNAIRAGSPTNGHEMVVHDPAMRYMQDDGEHIFSVAPANTPIAATAMSASTVYIIVTLGTTDFTSFGAATNVVGVKFTASGAGTGTGTAVPAAVTFTDAMIIDVDGRTTVTDLVAPANFNAQTGTAYTGVIGDAEIVITMNNAGANTFTIPANASVAYDVGTKLTIIQLGAGATTVAITTDTLNVDATYTKVLAGQYSVANCLKITSTSWVIFGGLVPV